MIYIRRLLIMNQKRKKIRVETRSPQILHRLLRLACTIPIMGSKLYIQCTILTFAWFAVLRRKIPFCAFLAGPVFATLIAFLNLTSCGVKQTSIKYRSHNLLRASIHCVVMMTSSNGNIFCVAGHLCMDFTGHRWIPLTKASDAELWCFLWSAPE